MVNKHRLEVGSTPVGISAVFSAYLRLKPVVTPITASKQGNMDPESPWAKARLKLSRQTAIRLGLEAAFWDNITEGICPDYFNPSMLTAISLHQIVPWDETHKNVRIGGIGPNGSKRQVRFHRDANGKLDPNGILAAPKTFLNTKYTHQSRFSFGCAMVKLLDGSVIGKRCEVFKYTGQWIRTIKEWDILVAAEIDRVKKLSGAPAPWVTGLRDKSNGINLLDLL